MSFLKILEEKCSGFAKEVHDLAVSHADGLESLVESIAVKMVGGSDPWQAIKNEAELLMGATMTGLEKRSKLVEKIESILPAGTSTATMNWLAETAVNVLKNSLSKK